MFGHKTLRRLDYVSIRATFQRGAMFAIGSRVPRVEHTQGFLMGSCGATAKTRTAAAQHTPSRLTEKRRQIWKEFYKFLDSISRQLCENGISEFVDHVNQYTCDGSERRYPDFVWRD